VAREPIESANAIREELERASSLISVQPEIGARARNTALAGVRRIQLARVRYDLYYRVVTDPERNEVLAFWHESRAGRSANLTCVSLPHGLAIPSTSSGSSC